MRSFQTPESFVVKSVKIFDLFQFFFLNVGADVIEIKDALFSSRGRWLAPFASRSFHSLGSFLFLLLFFAFGFAFFFAFFFFAFF